MKNEFFGEKRISLYWTSYGVTPDEKNICMIWFGLYFYKFQPSKSAGVFDVSKKIKTSLRQPKVSKHRCWIILVKSIFVISNFAVHIL